MSNRYQLTYSQLLKKTIVSMMVGLKLTLQHFIGARNKRAQVGVMDGAYFKQPDGIMTNQYPFEQLPIPDNGRYQLHNEIDDCIVCDLCAKVCPVNCIEIDPIKSPVEIGKTSDGSTKRIYAATFNIDMAKCCFCGLCTTVCPTECLTMTKTFDFSEFNVNKLTYAFAELSHDEAEVKRKEYEIFAQQEKDKKANKTAVNKDTEKSTGNTGESTAQIESKSAEQPTGSPKVVLPKIKPVIPIKKDLDKEGSASEEKPKPTAVPKLKPIIPIVKKEEGKTEAPSTSEIQPNSIPPKLKPVIPALKKEITSNTVEPKQNITVGEQDSSVSPTAHQPIKNEGTPDKQENKLEESKGSPSNSPAKPVIPKLKPVIPKRIPPKEDTNNE
jgi:NADH-quinone oxidoreductase subunit I